MRHALDGAAVMRWWALARERIELATDELNRLNVFPVRDADTGTNLRATVLRMWDEVVPSDDAADCLAALAKGALVGAHGNSGTILSQLVCGFADTAAAMPTLGPGEVVAALQQGVRLAYAAVGSPVEGTVLTVARAASEAALASLDAGGTLPDVVRMANEGAARALADTPRQLPVLAAAGVVDAGGRGWCIVLDALAAVVSESEAPAGRSQPQEASATTVASAADQPAALTVAATPVRHDDAGTGGGPAYEVQFLLSLTEGGPAADRAAARLRQELAALGDSLVVAGADRLRHVHVHVDDVAAAISAGHAAGHAHGVTVTPLVERPSAGHPATPRVVALLSGPGLAAVAAAAGALVLPTDDEVTAQAAVAGQPGTPRVMVPSDRASETVAASLAERLRAAGGEVVVVPARSPVQALAALAVHDGSRPYPDDAAAMTGAALATRSGAVLPQPKSGDSGGSGSSGSSGGSDSGGSSGASGASGASGDDQVGRDPAVVGMVGDRELGRGDDALAVAVDVVEALLRDGGDLITLVTGDQPAPDLVPRLTAHLRSRHPGLEVQVYDGGQPGSILLVGVE